MQPKGDAPPVNSAPASLRKRLAGLRDKAVAEPWRVMTFIWQTLKAALLPISLRDVPRLLARFLEHLQRGNERCRERQAAAFNRHLKEIFG